MRLVIAPLRAYWHFIRANTRFAAFGFLLTLASSFGQTFFISLSNDHLQREFNLTHSGLGLVYSLATFASGATLIWAGGLIDRINLRTMTVAVCIGMIVACISFASAVHILMLGAAIYLLRLNGQGLLGHIAITSMARYFHKQRGKAISVASLGYPTGEAILPTVGVALIVYMGWRATWFSVAGALAITLIPMVLWLLLGHDARHRAHIEAEAELVEGAEGPTPEPIEPHKRTVRSWTRREVLRDMRFYMLLPAVLSPAFVVTGIIFHQLRLIAEKGWTMQWFAACFAGYAIAQVFSSLLVGELIDRFGSKRLFPFFLAPLACGLLMLAFVDHMIAALGLLVFAGLTSGTTGPVIGSMWAELYGVKYLGAIRAVATSAMVFSTSASPALMGVLIDRGVRVDTMSGAFVIAAVIVSVLAFIALRAVPGPARK
jgi:MFS family permease